MKSRIGGKKFRKLWVVVGLLDKSQVESRSISKSSRSLVLLWNELSFFLSVFSFLLLCSSELTFPIGSH